MRAVQSAEPRSPEPPTITRIDMHAMLSNERRRLVLEELRVSSPRTVAALAEAIATAETGERPPPRKKRQSAYVTLHQTHLPKLDALGLVEYDARAKVVSLGPDALPHIESMEPPTGPTPADVGGALALVALGLAGSLGSLVGVPLVNAISPLTYTTVTLVVLLLGFTYRLGRDRAGRD